jgi:uncharacterized membrane protein
MTMSKSQRILAFLAYLLLVVGWILVLLFGRRSRFAVYHMKQSMALVLFLLAVAAGWAVFTWLSAWISFLFIVGVASFSLVMAAIVFGLVAWIVGMGNALGARMRPLPIVGAWAKRLPPR